MIFPALCPEAIEAAVFSCCMWVHLMYAGNDFGIESRIGNELVRGFLQMAYGEEPWMKERGNTSQPTSRSRGEALSCSKSTNNVPQDGTIRSRGEQLLG